MYTLKSLVRRGLAFGGAAALVVAAVAPMAQPALADALNPLTDRSLTLSSSAPGWDYTDGSGNTTYAPPNSGANGQKTGNTFDFKVSTDTSAAGEEVHAMTFQYCTTSAGDCLAPGDNGWTDPDSDPQTDDSTRNADSATTSDLNVATATPTEVTAFSTIVGADGDVQAIPNADDTEGNYVVYYETSTPGIWAQSTGWDMSASNKETGTVLTADATGANNFITLTNETGEGFTANTRVKVVFFATDDNYITNPGSGAFFVKINTYDDESTFDESTLVDGGVTVANVMNHSIAIQTKVLETMQFSVGTVDPNTLDSTGGATGGDGSGSDLYIATGGQTAHGTCDEILTSMVPGEPVNVLKMGNQTAEDSLETDKTFSTHSYWRLSSNSSAGATVYYSGVTLSNTVGDDIDAIGATKAEPLPGSEQFGLAIANETSGNYAVDWSTETTQDYVYENGADGSPAGVHASTTTEVGSNPSYHDPQLFPLVANSEYSDGAGTVNLDYAGVTAPIDTAFAFDTTSNTIPVAIATENDQVVDCVTAKMRYIANIAATTPAGVYTTKVNYIAAPQY